LIKHVGQGEENKQEQMKYLEKLKKDNKKFLELEKTIKIPVAADSELIY
jgi:hypothetical protein